MKTTLLFILFLLVSLTAHGSARKEARTLLLGETEIKINVYENAGADVTFFAPHYNEKISRLLAKESVERNGGRLIEIESIDEKGNDSRYVKFALNGNLYTIDPNRIYTENGRNCQNFAPEVAQAVKQFADRLLQIIFAADGRTLRANEHFIIAVHNNVDVDAKAESIKEKDLTAIAFVKAQSVRPEARGAFEAQADGVFLSNTETDADNFIFLSTPRYVGYFAERGFNVVVQKAPAKLQSKQCSVDDGSLSVYAWAKPNFLYLPRSRRHDRCVSPETNARSSLCASAERRTNRTDDGCDRKIIYRSPYSMPCFQRRSTLGLKIHLS
jgi:hypothetical protein